MQELALCLFVATIALNRPENTMDQEAVATMARPRGRPKTSVRHDINVKFDKALADMARMVAKAEGRSLAEYLTDAARPTIEREYGKLMARLLRGPKP